MIAISICVILLAVLAWGLLHSYLASLKFKAIIRHRFGPATDRWFRLAYNLFAIITFLPILALPVLLEDKVIYVIHYPWVILTSALQLLALVTLIVGLQQTGAFSFLGVRQLLLPEDCTSAHLVTTGLYKHVRHPLYTAGLVLVWLIPGLTWNLLAVNLGITIYIVIGAHFEERKLMREFGETYFKYRDSTAMLIPGVRFPSHKD